MIKTLLFILLLFSGAAAAQPPFISGTYSDGLHLMQVDKMHIRGYFESYTGMDETTGSPVFSCIFFIEGTYKSTDKYTIKTFFPFWTDTIQGELMVADTDVIHILLDQDHGGCWNVQSFAGEWMVFNLDQKETVINYTYAKPEKAYFYQTASSDTKRKAYILQGQFVQVEKIEGDFAYCIYNGKKVTKGWMRLEDLMP